MACRLDALPLTDETEDQYDLGALLGQGGFGKVIKAYHRVQEKDVALKIIPFSVITSDEIRKRIENEINIHRKLFHQNIIGFYGCFIDNQQYFLVLECANGNNLCHYLKAFGAFSEAKTTIVAFQILLALQYLHRRNIVHRDVKLSNLLVMRSPARLSASLSKNSVLQMTEKDKAEDVVIKLCDFGLAVEVAHPDDDQYTFCGTPSYMAPEISNRSDCGFPVDIWATGIVLKALLTGLLPVSVSIPNHASPPPLSDLPKNISAEAISFLKGAFTEEPRKRPTASRLLQHSLMKRYQAEISLLNEANASSLSTYTTRVSSLSGHSFSSPFAPSVFPMKTGELRQSGDFPILGNAAASRDSVRSTANNQINVRESVSTLRAPLSVGSQVSTLVSSDLYSSWSKICGTLKQLPSFFFAPTSPPTSRSLFSASETSGRGSQVELTEVMFHTREGDIYYFYKRYKIFLCLREKESLQAVRLGKWSKEDQQRLRSFYCSLPSDPSVAIPVSVPQRLESSNESETPRRKVLHCFDEHSYPLKLSKHSSCPSSSASTSTAARDLAAALDLCAFPKALSSHDLFLSLPELSSSGASAAQPNVKAIVSSLLSRIAPIVERVSRQLPRITIFTFDPLASQSGGKSKGQSIKCMFMSNRPLPDFHIQWKDRTRLVYSLKTSHLSIARPATSDGPAVRWEGVVDLSADSSGGSSVPDPLQPFLLSGQLVVLKCLREERRWRDAERRPAKDKKGLDSSPGVLFLT